MGVSGALRPLTDTIPSLGKLLFLTLRRNKMYRKHVNKNSSAKSFRRNVGHTKAINVRGAPMRGGIRL